MCALPIHLKEIGKARFVRRCLAPVARADKTIQGRRGRYGIYAYLRRVYAAYLQIRAAQSTKTLRKFASCEMRKSIRKGSHPIRIVIDATSSEPNPKVKSRWARALEFAHHNDVSPERLRQFFRQHGGIAGCARWAAEKNPAKWSPRRHWTD